MQELFKSQRSLWQAPCPTCPRCGSCSTQTPPQHQLLLPASAREPSCSMPSALIEKRACSQSFPAATAAHITAACTLHQRSSAQCFHNGAAEPSLWSGTFATLCLLLEPRQCAAPTLRSCADSWRPSSAISPCLQRAAAAILVAASPCLLCGVLQPKHSPSSMQEEQPVLLQLQHQEP